MAENVVSTDETGTKKYSGNNLTEVEKGFAKLTTVISETSEAEKVSKVQQQVVDVTSKEAKDESNTHASMVSNPESQNQIKIPSGQVETTQYGQVQTDVVPQMHQTYPGFHGYYLAPPLVSSVPNQQPIPRFPGHPNQHGHPVQWYPYPNMQYPGSIPFHPYPFTPPPSFHQSPSDSAPQTSHNIPVTKSTDVSSKTPPEPPPNTNPASSTDPILQSTSPMQGGGPSGYYPYFSHPAGYPFHHSLPLNVESSNIYGYYGPVADQQGSTIVNPGLATGYEISGQPQKVPGLQPQETSSHHSEAFEQRKISILDEHRIFIENASKKTPLDCIENFLEAKTELTIESVLPGGRDGSFLVTFKEKPDIGQLQDLVKKRKIDDSWLKVSKVMKSACVILSGLNPKTTEDNIRFYFMNKRKSNGGEIRSVRMSEDRRLAVVSFCDPEVAERVCEKQHMINEKRVSVELYHECLERGDGRIITSAGQSDEVDSIFSQIQHSGKPTASTATAQQLGQTNGSNRSTHREQEPRRSKEEASRSIIVKSLDSKIVYFLCKSDIYQKQFVNYVKDSHSGRVMFISQPNDKVLLRVDFAAADSEHALWQSNAEKEIAGYVIECLKLTSWCGHVPIEALPQVYGTINPILSKHKQLVQCYKGTSPSDIIICGEAGKVESIKTEITKVTKECETLPRKSEAMNLQPYQTHYLILIKFAERFPKVKTNLNTSTNTAGFEGPKEAVISAKTECLRILHNLLKEDVTYKTKEAMNLFDSSGTSEFIHQNLEGLSCTWERLASEDKIRVYAETESAVKKGSSILQKSISEVPIPLDSITQNVLMKAEWKEKQQHLLEVHKGRLQFVKDKRTLWIVTTSDVREELKTEVERFLKTNSFRTMTIPLEAPIARFLRSFKTNAIHSLEEKLKKNQVTILVDEGILCDEIRMSGYGDGCTEAEKLVSGIVSKIFCKQHQISLPGIEEFFVKGKGRELLVAVEQNEKCVIKPKESSPAVTQKEVKRWDVPGGGTLSVIRGDMRDLKVDAIVNAANKDLQHAGGVAKAIVDKGGNGIQKESDRYIKDHGQLADGQAICTAAGKLPCKVIIHAVGPVWSGGDKGEEEILQETVKNILNVADKNKLCSVAIPAISTGIFGYPLESAVNTIMETLLNHWQPDSDDFGRLKEVCFCDIKKETVDLFVDVGEKLFGQEDVNNSDSNEDEDDDDGRSSDEESILKEEPSTQNLSGTDSDGESEAETESVGGSLQIDDGPGIKVVMKELSAMKADVLVNPAKCDLDLSDGAISRSLLKAAGDQLQEECNMKYEDGINHGEVAVTKGGNLQCNVVFHGLLMKWNQGRGKAEKILQNLVTKCLEEADRRGFTSIAFPALGTGRQSFPADIAACLMFKAVRTFLDSNPESSVKTVYFVIHPDDRAIVKAFKEAEHPDDGDGYLTSTRPSTASQHRPSSRRHRTFGTTSGSTYQVGPVSVEILKGDITMETTDCIVNACKESCDLSYSAVSKALSKAAGFVLQSECTAKRSDMSKYGFIITSSGNLQCQMVAHLKAQTSNWGWISVLQKCMDRLNKRNITSMSIPALGTGGLKQSPKKMAGVIYDAITKFGSTSRHPSLRHVRVVIFKDEMVSSFQAVFAGNRYSGSSSHGKRTGHSRQKHRGSRRHSKRTGHKSHDDDIIDMSNKHIDDKVTLCIYTDDKKSVESAKARLTKLCKEEFDHKPLPKSCNTFIEKLKNKELSALYRIADESGVALTKTPSGLTLTGQVRLVSSAHDTIMDKLQSLQKVAQMQEEARTLAKLVEWAYIDEKGHSTLFTPGLNCRLEKAKNAKLSKIDIEDVKGRKYTVDLGEMVEYPADGGKPITIRRVEKGGSSGLGQYVDGEKEALAGTTTVYFPLVPDRNFKGTAEDLHFRTAESQFYRLLSGHSVQYKVAKVEYVVNPHLVQQFRAAQVNLKKSRGEMHAQPVLAFHGTDVNNITKICEQGFLKSGDPGFQMKSGNKFGNGVYFSEFPDYSMGYIRGATKLLLCKVLLGKTYTISSFTSGGVQAGYDSHTSSNGKELVIFDTSRILPCYVVHYSKTTSVPSYI